MRGTVRARGFEPEQSRRLGQRSPGRRGNDKRTSHDTSHESDTSERKLEAAALKRRAVSGALWTIASSAGGRVVGLIATLVLTRFLAPEAYGAVAIASVAVATVSALTGLGVGQYVVAHPKESPSTTFHASVLCLGVGITALTGAYFARHALAELFGTPDLARYLPGVVAAAMFERIAYLPGRILARDMRFRALGLRQLAGEAAYAVVAVGLALFGLGGMALVWGMIARAATLAVSSVLSIRVADWLRVSPLSFATTRKMMKFAAPMTLADILAWLARRGDNLLMAGLFGPAIAGQYNLAYNLADVPATHIGEHIGDVLLPSFASMEDPRARLRVLVRAEGLLALVVFPLAIGLGLVAHSLVTALFDPRWAMVAPLLAVLSALSVLRPVGWLVGAYLQATHQPGLVLRLEAVKTAGLFVLLPALARIGPVAAACGVGIAYAASSGCAILCLRRQSGLGIVGLVAPLAAPLAACAAMVPAVLVARLLLTRAGSAPGLVLGAEIALGAAAYVAAALVLAPHQARDLLSLARRGKHARAFA